MTKANELKEPELPFSNVITIFYDHQDDRWVCDIGEMESLLAERLLERSLECLQESSPEIQIRWTGGVWPDPDEDDE